MLFISRKIERRRCAFEGVEPDEKSLERARKKRDGITEAYEKRRRAIYSEFQQQPTIAKLTKRMFDYAKTARKYAKLKDPESEKAMVEAMLKNSEALLEYAQRLLEFAEKNNASHEWIKELKEKADGVEIRLAFGKAHKKERGWIEAHRKDILSNQ